MREIRFVTGFHCKLFTSPRFILPIPYISLKGFINSISFNISKLIRALYTLEYLVYFYNNIRDTYINYIAYQIIIRNCFCKLAKRFFKFIKFIFFINLRKKTTTIQCMCVYKVKLFFISKIVDVVFFTYVFICVTLQKLCIVFTTAREPQNDSTYYRRRSNRFELTLLYSS